MAHSLFLELCQELRDIIYDHTLSEDDHALGKHKEALDGDGLETSGMADEYGWYHRYPSTFSPPTWLALMKTSRQLKCDITAFLARRQKQRPKPGALSPGVRARVHINHPHCTTEILSIPGPPTRAHALHLEVHISSLFDSANLSPSNAVSTVIWQTLQHYRTHGPRLGRHAPLTEPLRLQKMRISLAGPEERDLVFTYGNPWMQLQSHYSSLKYGLGEFARAAEDDGKGFNCGVGMIETSFAGRQWEQVYVAKKGRDSLELSDDEKLARSV